MHFDNDESRERQQAHGQGKFSGISACRYVPSHKAEGQKSGLKKELANYDLKARFDHARHGNGHQHRCCNEKMVVCR